MIDQYETILTLFIVLIGVITYRGLNEVIFREKYIFHIDSILIDKQSYRLFTSGFLHGDWIHFAFNAIALSSFGVYALIMFGLWKFFLVYVGSLLAGSLLSLYVHRNHADYRALGASGAVFGIVFATIVYDPFAQLSFIFVPIEFPAWVFGIILVAVSIFGIKRSLGNIGHDAHLGGAIFGIIITAILLPESLRAHPWIYALVGIPSLGFLFLIIRYPHYLLVEDFSVTPFVGNSRPKPKKGKSEAEELDMLLDKISREGIDKLTKKERKRLDQLSGKP